MSIPTMMSILLAPFRSQVKDGFFRNADEFRKVLHHEQLRAERSGHAVSLLIFWSDAKLPFDQQLDYFETVWAARFRRMDQAGMLGHGKIGVVLPYTTIEDARKLSDDLRTLVFTRVPDLTCEVSQYPPPAPFTDSGNFATSSRSAERRFGQTRRSLMMQATSWCEHLFDFTGAAVALAVCLPLMLAVALAIKLTSPGPILFRQRREGRWHKPFTIYKFRTMYVGADAMQAALRVHSDQDGPAFKMFDDPRVTPIGRFLRSTCIDETPQFVNVLRREMSLVGPRPLPVAESVSCATWQRRRLDVRPGITCIWQVDGRSRVPFDQWMRMDLAYVRSRSLLVDLTLLWKTVPAVLRGTGAKMSALSRTSRYAAMRVVLPALDRFAQTTLGFLRRIGG